jgi:very-short-patch-repair endonuclease
MSDSVSDDRYALVSRKAAEWAAGLVDLGHRNTLLHFKDTKTASLDLSGSSLGPLDRLLSGSAETLRALQPDPHLLKEACVRAKNIRRRIVALEEEQGIEAGRIAHGLVRLAARPGASGRPTPALRAPLLLRAVEINAKTVSESDYTLQPGDEVEINPVLLYSLVHEHGAELKLEEFTERLNAVAAEADGPQSRLRMVYETLQTEVAHWGIELELEAKTVIGLFSYEKLPMVEDLLKATQLLAGNDVISALAGDTGALNALQQDGRGFTFAGVDDISPRDEVLVQDADSSQERAISAALSGHNVLIEGPPGTGKSQTIANIIAGAAAQGQKVLFVAEKRAAIEAVTQRLADVDLGGLVFDLHQQKLNKRQLAQQLAESLDRAAAERPVRVDELNAGYADRRRRAVAYTKELHAVRSPWEVSAFQTMEESLRLSPAAQTRLRFRGPILQTLSAGVLAEVRQDLQEYVDSGGPRIRRGDSPWSNATEVRTEADIDRVLLELDALTAKTLHRSTQEMELILRQTGLAKPAGIDGWSEVLELLGGIEQAVAEFGQEVFRKDLDLLYLATADRSVRKADGRKLSFGDRRRAVKAARAMSRRGIKRRQDLNRALSEVCRQRERWQHLGGQQSDPSGVEGLADIVSHYTDLCNQLAAVALCTRIEDLDRRPAEDVQSQLAELEADRDTLFRMPRLTELTQRFEATGLGPLLDEIVERDADAEQAAAILRHAWLQSLIDQFKVSSPVLRDFAAGFHTRTVAEFCAADVRLREVAPSRVRREVARRLSEACDEYPDQGTLVRNQAKRKTGHMPIRKLVESASDVLLALRPCWAMSPLLVSKTLPAECLFDIVIFDEASQILPQDAITSIVRGRKIVVAGDDRQLPPSTYFQRMLGGAEEDDEDEDSAGGLKDYESILARLSSLLTQRHMLRWHYRSRDERLIAFSNNEIYDRQLVTFPGVLEGSPITLDVVDGRAVPGQDGSAVAEVEKVVERVLEHAAERPDESLGVIAMSQKHADRIDAALRAALRDRPELERFFGDEMGASRRFFVKNLERVQGDERDAIILSVGYAKRPDGRVARTFGPLNREGGERRLNVAVTRAKRRMAVVSSFSHADLEPRPDRSGAELLRRFLEFAELGGDLTRVGRIIGGEMNGFEDSVFTALREEGIPVYPQWGFSNGYRIDFALGHPEQQGRMVLAVETDGEQYHLVHSARDRDRLRQSHLENLGWRFHRLWSTAWFSDPGGELERIVESWRQAMKDDGPAVVPIVRQVAPVLPAAAPSAQHRSLPRPEVPFGQKITEYTDYELVSVFTWLLSDELYLTREARIEQGMKELGFSRRGKNIIDRLTAAFETARTQYKGEH